MSRQRIASWLFIVTAIGGLLPFAASFWWGFELFAHFRVQYVVLAALLAVFAIVIRRRSLAVLLGIIAALNAGPLLPYLPAAHESPGSAFQFDVLAINVNAQNADYVRITEAILRADADLVTVIELTPALDRALATIEDRYPHRFTVPTNGNFGIGIFSRFPLSTVKESAFGPTPAIDSIVELPTGALRFLAAHLYPPIGMTLAETRNRQLDQLAAYVRDVEESILICGDFNLTPYSPLFKRFTEAGNVRDVRLGQGLEFSWPAFFPAVGIPIDHCLIRGPFAVESVKRLDRFGSDHYPVQVSLVWQESE